VSAAPPIIAAGSAAAPDLRIELIDWNAARAAASRIRVEVFVREQAVPLELELDEWDAPSLHALAVPEGIAGPVGTARLLPDGHIGRMAVLRPWRRRGVGRALLDALIARARADGHREVVVHAQMYVTAFYEQAGFMVSSRMFEEAGIPHVEMRRLVTAATP
jgi:predicted GNAT family N-acyltransferase